jgi:hypothetical protein
MMPIHKWEEFEIDVINPAMEQGLIAFFRSSLHKGRGAKERKEALLQRITEMAVYAKYCKVCKEIRPMYHTKLTNEEITKLRQIVMKME